MSSYLVTVRLGDQIKVKVWPNKFSGGPDICVDDGQGNTVTFIGSEAEIDDLVAQLQEGAIAGKNLAPNTLVEIGPRNGANKTTPLSGN